jgi:hypothetical protein
VKAKLFFFPAVINFRHSFGGAVAQLGARLDGIEEVVGSNPIGSTNFRWARFLQIVRSHRLVLPLLSFGLEKRGAFLFRRAHLRNGF